MKKRIAYYSIFLGFTIIGMWLNYLISGNIPEGQISVRFHLISEFAMAIICLISGVMMIKDKPLAIETNILGIGMVIYSTLNAAGYYSERGERFMMAMFVILCALSVLVIIGDYILLKNKV